MFLKPAHVEAITAAIYRVMPSATEIEFRMELEVASIEVMIDSRGYLQWRSCTLGKRLFVRISEAQNWRCCYCGTRTFIAKSNCAPNCATLEHVVAKCLGGEDHPDNLVMACVRCNSDRGSKLSNGRHLEAEARVTL